MIYINKDTTEVLLPKVVINDAVKIRFISQISHSVSEENIVDDGNTTYYKITLQNKDFEVGLYDYTILGTDDIVLSQGIMQYGDYVPSTTEYNGETNIIVYNG